MASAVFTLGLSTLDRDCFEIMIPWSLSVEITFPEIFYRRGQRKKLSDSQRSERYQRFVLSIGTSVRRLDLYSHRRTLTENRVSDNKGSVI